MYSITYNDHYKGLSEREMLSLSIYEKVVQSDALIYVAYMASFPKQVTLHLSSGSVCFHMNKIRFCFVFFRSKKPTKYKVLACQYITCMPSIKYIYFT